MRQIQRARGGRARGATAARRGPGGNVALVAVTAVAILAVLAMGSARGAARGSAPEPHTQGLVAAGPASPATSASSAGVGQGVKVTAVRFEVAAADDVAALWRVAVYLEVRNRGEKVATFTPLDVALRDSEGEVHAAYDRESDRSPSLPGVVLNPGGQIEGWRVFEVPAGTGGFVLLYHSDAMDSAVEVGLPRPRGAVSHPVLKPLSQRP